VALAQAAAHLYARGCSLAAQLAALYAAHGGAPAYRSGYVTSDTPAATFPALFDRLRSTGYCCSSGTIADYAAALGAASDKGEAIDNAIVRGFTVPLPYSAQQAAIAAEALAVAGSERTGTAALPVRVTWVRDLGVGLDTSQAVGVASLPWRRGDMMVTYSLEADVAVASRLSAGAAGAEQQAGGETAVIGAVGGIEGEVRPMMGPKVTTVTLACELTLRASGTEPKLKYYLEVLPPSPGSSDRTGSSSSIEGGLAEHAAAVLADAMVRELVFEQLLRVDATPGLKRPGT
jgi:hypothetical protein